MSAKYVFVTGGVVSSLGKGITAASLGRLLKARGYRVSMQKLIPITMSILVFFPLCSMVKHLSQMMVSPQTWILVIMSALLMKIFMAKPAQQQEKSIKKSWNVNLPASITAEPFRLCPM